MTAVRTISGPGAYQSLITMSHIGPEAAPATLFADITPDEIQMWESVSDTGNMRVTRVNRFGGFHVPEVMATLQHPSISTRLSTVPSRHSTIGELPFGPQPQRLNLELSSGLIFQRGSLMLTNLEPGTVIHPLDLGRFRGIRGARKAHLFYTTPIRLLPGQAYDEDVAMACKRREAGINLLVNGSKDLDRIKAEFMAASEVFEEKGLKNLQADCLLRLGKAARSFGDIDLAKSSLEKAKALFRSVGDSYGVKEADKLLLRIKIRGLL